MFTRKRILLFTITLLISFNLFANWQTSYRNRSKNLQKSSERMLKTLDSIIKQLKDQTLKEITKKRKNSILVVLELLKKYDKKVKESNLDSSKLIWIQVVLQQEIQGILYNTYWQYQMLGKYEGYSKNMPSDTRYKKLIDATNASIFTNKKLLEEYYKLTTAMEKSLLPK